MSLLQKWPQFSCMMVIRLDNAAETPVAAKILAQIKSFCTNFEAGNNFFFKYFGGHVKAIWNFKSSAWLSKVDQVFKDCCWSNATYWFKSTWSIWIFTLWFTLGCKLYKNYTPKILLFLIQYIKINILCEKVLLRTNFRSDLLTQCRLFVEAVTD